MRRISIVLLTLFTFGVSAAWPQADAPKKQPTIITFDPPDAVVTQPQAINPAGVIAGFYFDASFVEHGFLRAKDGTFTSVDGPGAPDTAAFSINPAGAIAGAYLDASFVSHGLLRAPDGTITTFDAPGAGTGAFQGTEPLNINPAGATQDCTLTRALCITASCALLTAPSRRSTLPARAPGPARAPKCQAP